MQPVHMTQGNQIDQNTTTVDHFFDGGLVLHQWAKGHRIGTDAVLLAAACPAGGGKLADIGCGVGAVGLRAALRYPQSHVILIDNDPAILALTQSNILGNTLTERVSIQQADMLTPLSAQPALARDLGTCDIVLTNPPFAEAGLGRPSPVAAKARAHIMAGPQNGDGLEHWVRSAVRFLAPKGRLVIIHRADATKRLLAALPGHMGDIRLRFIHPRAGQTAHRVLIHTQINSRAPLAVLPPLILHGADGRFTDEVDALHRGSATLGW